MIVIYSDQASGFLPDCCYRNPQYFQAPLGQPEKVVVMGHWPAVVAAYRDLGIEVEERPAFEANLQRSTVTLPPPPQKLVDGVSLPQLDHDGDGKPGGSAAPEQTDDLKALRETYRTIVGKKAFPGWDSETLRQKIAAANG